MSASSAGEPHHGAYFAAGPCYLCGGIFTFDPERVPSIRVDDRGNISADGVRQPICRTCIENVNVLRARFGKDPIPILDGAYEPREGFPP